MPIRPFKKIQHSRMPINEAQKNYYMTMLLNEINLIKSNMAAYRANIGNLQNDIKKAEHQVVKLENNLTETTAEYKKVQALDFTKEPEPVTEAEPEIPETIPEVEEPVEPEPTPEPEPEPEKKDELDALLEEKGLTRERIIELLKKE